MRLAGKCGLIPLAPVRFARSDGHIEVRLVSVALRTILLNGVAFNELADHALKMVMQI
jgi:hypothetical protein